MTDPFAPGSVIEGYTLGERLHAGAMGDVFRVTHPAHQTPMVMKVPRFGAGDSAENVLGFETESTILPALTGPYVARFFSAGDLTRLPFVVVEFIPGESLEAIVQRGVSPPPEVARLGAALADALHSIHRQDTIHHDLKPDNVMVRPDGNVTLIDFGLSHHARFPDLLAEENRFAAGSAPYVSPEQVQRCRTDPRSDLFALGVVLYELATGELPFGAPATNAGMRDRLWLDPKPPRARVADVPPWLQEIILRCLEVDPAERYQSAAHIAFDLRHPAQVALTSRAEKSQQAGFLAQVRRWWQARERGPAEQARDRAPLSSTPVIVVAVDTVHPDADRHAAIRRATQQILSASDEYRLVCVSVLRGFETPGEPERSSFSAADPHLDHLVRLRHWADPLRLPPERLSLHVLDSSGTASTLVDFARRNHADLIILGAPDASQRGLAWLRSAASTVAANAPCSVHLVRLPEGTRQDAFARETGLSPDDLPQ